MRWDLRACTLLGGTLFFPLSLIASKAPKIDSILAKCASGSEKNCRELGSLYRPAGEILSLVDRTTSSEGLFKIATLAYDSKARLRAVNKMVPGTKPFITIAADRFQRINVRLAALSKIADQYLDQTDQNLLLKVAADERVQGWIGKPHTPWSSLSERDEERDVQLQVLRAALSKVTDQGLLRRYALTRTDGLDVRLVAIASVDDQSLLANIATDVNESSDVRIAAILRLRDESVIAKLAEDFRIRDVSLNALARLTNRELLGAAVAKEGGDDTRRAVARATMALLEERIRLRLPDIALVVSTGKDSAVYEDRAKSGARVAEGETVRFTLVENSVIGSLVWKNSVPFGLAVAEESWAPSFPQRRRSIQGKDFPKIETHGMFVRILHLPIFTQKDLQELAASAIPTVRAGAAANLLDQALLSKIAVSDPDSGVRQAAVARVNDQAILAKVASDVESNFSVRVTAIAGLTDEESLMKLATDAAAVGGRQFDPGVRAAAVRRMRDQAFLTKIESRDEHKAGISDSDSDSELGHRLVMEAKYAEAEGLLGQTLATERRWREDGERKLNLLSDLALVDLALAKYSESETLSRELYAGSSAHPLGWRNSLAQSLIGASLAGSRRYLEAEPLLLEGYRGLEADSSRIPARDRHIRESARRWLFELYERWGQPEKAASWVRK